MTSLPHSSSAELRTLRLASIAVGLTTVAAVTATTIAVVRPQQSFLGPELWALLVPAVALPVLCGATAAWAGMRLLRGMNAAIAIEYLVLLAALLAAAVLGPRGDVPWFFTLTAVPVAAALIAWGGGAAWAMLAVSTLLVQAIRIASGGDLLAALSSDVLVLFSSVALILLFGPLISASRVYDDSALAAVTAAGERAEREARASARERFQAFVHDELLATLLLAAEDEPRLRDRVATQARRAASLIRQLHTASRASFVPADSVVDRLRDEIAQVAPDAAFCRRGDSAVGGPRLVVPGEAVDALSGAARQALTNSVRHAGGEASRSVEVRVTPDALVVVVRDDGVGFEPSAVDPARMGISSSIVGRMRSVLGGDARVESTPHGGTVVVLSWAVLAEPESAASSTATDDAIVLPAAVRRPPYGLAIAIALFLASQAVLAVLAGVRASDGWVNGLAFAGLLASFAVLGRSSAVRPGMTQSMAVAALAVAMAVLSLVPIVRDEENYGDAWYLAAFAFVLLLLAARGRPWAAAGTAVLTATIAVTGAASQSNDAADVVAASSRLVVIVLIGSLFVIGIRTVRARTRVLRERDVAAARAAAARDAERQELYERSRDVEKLIGRTLERLAAGEALTSEVRGDCVALEGHLRDRYRAGRLVRSPLTEAAAAARGRGVDVVLQDDAPERALSDDELGRLVSWMAERLDHVPEGMFTGRILPVVGGALASAATLDDASEFS